MSDRLPVHHLTIPDRRPTVANAAGQVIIDALREAGLNPRNPAVQQHPMIRQMLGEWGRGEWTRAQFVHACRNVLIINPKLGA